MQLYPAVDLHGGRAVRLVKGEFDKATDYGEPLDLARSFVTAGATWLHLVDLDAALAGHPANRHLALSIAASVDVPIEFGGGVRTEADVEELLEGGVARVILGTAALEDSAFVRAMVDRHGSAIALGLDYRRVDGRLEAAARGWVQGSGRSVDEVLSDLSGSELGAVIVTAIERDGTLSGPDLDGLAAVLDWTEVPVVASGGVGQLGDLHALAALRGETGRSVHGVVVGRALVDGRVDLEEAIAACAA
jgi:phosphoribosylformimino-5-aminoimidazole carboxamide ribotide isomerase